MAREQPELLAALVDVAQRGRTLGVHLILATQRPAGVVNDHIRTNTNLRIALRVQDAADSTDVIGDRSAAEISRHRPGRAYFRLGPDEVIPLQSALITCVTDATSDTAVEVAPFEFGAPSRERDSRRRRARRRPPVGPRAARRRDHRGQRAGGHRAAAQAVARAAADAARPRGADRRAATAPVRWSRWPTSRAARPSTRSAGTSTRATCCCSASPAAARRPRSRASCSASPTHAGAGAARGLRARQRRGRPARARDAAAHRLGDPGGRPRAPDAADPLAAPRARRAPHARPRGREDRRPDRQPGGAARRVRRRRRPGADGRARPRLRRRPAERDLHGGDRRPAEHRPDRLDGRHHAEVAVPARRPLRLRLARGDDQGRPVRDARARRDGREQAPDPARPPAADGRRGGRRRRRALPALSARRDPGRGPAHRGRARFARRRRPGA